MKKELLIIPLLILAAFSFWFLRFNQVKIKSPSKPSKVEVVGRVTQGPKIIGQSQYFWIGQVKVRTRLYPEVYFGQRLRVEGTLQPDLRINFPDKIELLKSDTPKSRFLEKLNVFKNFLAKNIKENLPEPQSSLILGMILGVEELPFDFKQQLKQTGTIHVVVVSGQNVSLLGGFLTLLLPLLGRRKTIILTIFAIFFYVLLVGFQPPAVRAGIMGTIAYLGKIVGREAVALYSLFLAAFLILIFEPQSAFDLSFQLSFLATLGILLLGLRLTELLPKLPQILRENLAITLSAWFFTLPILAYNFSQISVIAPLSNLLVFFLITPIMIGGLILAFLGPVPILGTLLAFLLYLPAFLFTFIVQNLSFLPFAQAKIDQYPFPYLVLAYLLIFALTFFLNRARFQWIKRG